MTQTTKLKFSNLREKAIWFANLPRDTKASFSEIVQAMSYQCRLGLAKDMARYCEENADANP